MGAYSEAELIDTALSVLKNVAYNLEKDEKPVAATLVRISEHHLRVALDICNTDRDEMP